MEEDNPKITINLHSLIEKVEIINQKDSDKSIQEIEKKLIDSILKVLESCSNYSDTGASDKHKVVLNQNTCTF